MNTIRSSHWKVWQNFFLSTERFKSKAVVNHHLQKALHAWRIANGVPESRKEDKSDPGLMTVNLSSIVCKALRIIFKWKDNYI